MSGAIAATATALGATAATAATAGTVGTSLAAVAAIGGAGLSAVGSIESGNAAKAAAGYNAEVQRQNATIATQNANLSGAIGNENAGIQGMKNKAAVGGILASQGANNVDVNSGSAVDVRAGQEEAGQLSAQTIRSNAARQAYNYQVNSASDTGQANEDVFTGREASLSGDIGAGADLLKGAGSAAQLLGGNPQTPAQAYAAQQSSSGSILPTWDLG
jgi:hypothetical protein